MLISIHVAVINHKHGEDTYVAGTLAGIHEKVAGYCRECWEDVGIASAYVEPPVDDLECIEAYFDSLNDEWCDLSEHMIDTDTVPAIKSITDRCEALERFRAYVACNETTGDLFEEADGEYDYENVEDFESDMDDDTLLNRSYSLNQCIDDARELSKP